jgi:hypothetical protein
MALDSEGVQMSYKQLKRTSWGVEYKVFAVNPLKTEHKLKR